MSEFTDRVTAVAETIFERREFRHYAAHRDEIVATLVTGYENELRDKLRGAAGELATATAQRDDWVRRAGRRARYREYALLGSAAVAATVVTVPTTHEPLLRSWLLVAGIVLVLMYGVAAVRRHRGRRAVELPVTAATRRYERMLETAVQEGISAAVNDLLGPTGVIAFPTHAPRLVELDTSQVTPSSTIEYVREFVVEHESSAIGLAGPRGSGKSTVMRALRADPTVGLVTIVPSPVRYDPGEFMRVLLGEIARTLAGPSHVRTGPSRFSRFLRWALTIRWPTLLTTMLTSFLLFVIISAGQSFVDRLLNPVSVLAVLVTAATIMASWLKLMVRLNDSVQPPEVRRARELLRDLRWETERGVTTRSTAKAVSWLETGAERTVTLRHRGFTRAELAAELRALLALFAAGTHRTRLVVCVDELDKLDTVEHLVAVVNELKDLFHVQRVHFVVAVSTDALESFQRRGLSDRDAFDSAFDTVVHTQRLTVEESLAVVTSRAAGFAPLIAMFCHAWSGGLARDLLRAARAAVQRQRRDPDQALSVRQIVEHLVLTDLRAAIRASLRAEEPGAPQVTMLWALHQALADPDPVVPDLAFTTPALQALHAKARLGVSLLALAGVAQRLPRYWDQSSAALRALRGHIAEHATAMEEIGAQPPVREAALAVALREFDPAVLNPS